MQDPINYLFHQVVPYSKHFEGVRSERVFANFATSARAMRRKRDDGGDGGSADHRAFTPLSLLMESSILIPLRAQLAVVNSAVVNYLLVGAKLNDHFKVCGMQWNESRHELSNRPCP